LLSNKRLQAFVQKQNKILYFFTYLGINILITLIRHLPCFCVFACITFTANCQNSGIAEIDKAIADNKIDNADLLLQSAIETYSANGQADSLVNYVYYVGKINFLKSGKESANNKVELFIETIKKLTSNPVTIRESYIEAGEFYGSMGQNKLAYISNEQAYKYTLLIPEKTGTILAHVENNLATYAQRKGDLSLSQAHTRKALVHLLRDQKPNYEMLYMVYNGMGADMWYASKIDSSMYYYDLALQMLEKTPRIPVNQYYRPAIVQNNLSALYQLQGQITKAIEALKFAIKNLNIFLASDAPESKKYSVTGFQFEAMDNLAGIYKELGDMQKARELLEFSYQQKQKYLTADDPDIFISQILLGQLYFVTREYNKSILFLNNGLKNITASGSSYLFWQADACNALALLYDATRETSQAKFFYEKADSLYEETLQGDYDNIYLEFLSNSALFYAKAGDTKTAVTKANKGYSYVLKTQGSKTLLAFQQLLNLSEIYYLSGDYKKSLVYSQKGMEILRLTMHSTNNLLDSVRIELKKPKAVLFKTKAEYQLLIQKDSANLTPLYNELNNALITLERRKSVLTDVEDIQLVMREHSDLVDFVKKISYELYKHTNDKKYLDRLVGLHESGLYNRIRSRLDKNDSLQFAGVPVEILIEEKLLKSAISEALNGSVGDNEKISYYFKAVDEWNTFLGKLKLDLPEYYEIRYATLFKDMDYIQSSIPEKTTSSPLFFYRKGFICLVIDGKMRQIFPLITDSLEERISVLWNKVWILKKLQMHFMIYTGSFGCLFQKAFNTIK
jgi:hypothetical protein